jgi:ornithine cyclodeaminase/alanine dehydrogenase-like protein (mu-crystallin family)
VPYRRWIVGKGVKVTWLSQEECIAAGAQDMSLILEYVEKVNVWLSEGKIVESNLLHLLWDEHAHAGKRIGVHATLIRSEEMHVAAVKGIPSNPENPQEIGMPRSNGITIIYDEATCLPLAVMDDKVVSDMRTGAGSALGAQHCANPDSEILGIVGCGPIADAHIEATSLVMNYITTVRLYDTNEANAHRFSERWSKLGYDFEICPTCEAAVVDSDIVYTCTNVDIGNEYIPKEWVKRGSFHSPASVWDYTEEAVLQGFNKYAMDFQGRLQDRGYPLTELTIEDKLSRSDIKVIGNVIRGLETCRTTPDDTVYYCTLGICATDLAISYTLYQKAKHRELGVEVTLWNEPAHV